MHSRLIRLNFNEIQILINMYFRSIKILNFSDGFRLENIPDNIIVNMLENLHNRFYKI